MVELLRGLVPVLAILLGALATAAGLSRLPLGGAEGEVSGASSRRRRVSSLFLKEDWWAIWLGVGLVLFALLTFSGDPGLMRSLAINPGGLKWSDIDQLGLHFVENIHLYAVQFSVWAIFFGVTCRVMGIRFDHFLASFSVLYLVSMAIFAVSGWESASSYNLEPPLVALLLGLLLANTVRIPTWMDAALRVEYYVKFGIVLLGATFPISLVLSAGPVAIGQATFISLVSCSTIYFVGTRVFDLDRRLAAVLSVGGSVCGVSASMAIAAAVGAKKEHLYTSVTLVVGWALVMIVALPFISQALGLHPGVAGAWIGTSEFADAAGFAAASAYGKMAGNEEVAIKAFTLMKVIGRDLWIGIWALVWALVATTFWEKRPPGTKMDRREIWRRFPKFVIGFFVASIIVSMAVAQYDEVTFQEVVKPELLAPLGALRGWAFIFCFLSIGLTTRFRELKAVNMRSFSAFSIGVVINVITGFILSVYLFGEYWASL
ncbi:MAG: putative sulfate exporter family transporter [Magnetococcales bacterium]|nr:putative sulfate exporter family transporter [Magnetococcales bacterium]